MTREEVYISVDIEADGPVPGIYSMVSLGAAVVGRDEERFYAEIQPIEGSLVMSEAAAVHGLTPEYLAVNGSPAKQVMYEFRNWIQSVCGYDGKPVFVGFNSPFDWQFVNYYFWAFCDAPDPNPFGIRSLDIKSYYMGMSGCTYSKTTKSSIPNRFIVKSDNPHDAMWDAIAQARIFERMLLDERRSE